MITYTISSRLKRPLWRNIRRNVICACILLLIQATGAYADNSKKIVLLMSEDTQVYTTVAHNTLLGIQKKCPHTLPVCGEIAIVNAVAGEPLKIPETEIYMLITFGTKAASDRIAKEFTHEKIVAMIPRRGKLAADAALASDKVTMVYIDQPYARYFSLIKTVIPRALRIGVLLHVSDAPIIGALEEAAKSAGIVLKIAKVDSSNEVGESLSHLLGSIDALLALPDSRIHNSKTIGNILTTSYRNHIPVIGFSSAYVKAGATAAVYTSLGNIADQVSDIVIHTLSQGGIQGRELTAKYFSVSINFDVSRSLDISVTSPSEVMERMNQELSK